MSARGATHRLLEASSLAVRLGGRDVLSEVNLRVAAGEVVAVAGPNGAGKTTLLRALAGVVRPWRGLVRLQGELVEKMPRPRLARQLAYLPQETWTEFGLLVEDVVRLGRFPHVGMLRTLRAEDYRAVRDAMDQADVAHLARRPVTELSGGERRRVMVARAMAQSAEVLVLDEPTSALDIGHACALMELLVSLAVAGRAVVLSLHELTLATLGPHRLLLLDGGRVTAEGHPASVLTSPQAHQAFGVRLEKVGQPPVIVPRAGDGQFC